MMRRLSILLITSSALACQQEPPAGQDYYDRVIQPILTQSCAQGTSGCHRVEADDPFAFAAGNLDLTSFENVHRRPDVLRNYGAYPVPLLLIKSVGDTDELQIAYRDGFLDIEIQHQGGKIFDVDSEAFSTVLRWLENGATRDGIRPPDDPVEGDGDCSPAVPADFDPAVVTATQAWADHAGAFDAVQDVFTEKGCNARNCHGAPQADFYITCGTDADSKAFNFQQAWAFVNDPVDDSEILRRPLPPSLGGVSHSGGEHFTGRDEDPDYVTIRDWAEDVGPLDFGAGDSGKEFFANEIMPILLKRGCATEGCHSPAAMNDFKLRAGTQGFFSPIALERNYDLLKREFLAFEVPDVRRGRALAKNILPAYHGIGHRGGPLLETQLSGGTDPANCPPVYDPTSGVAYCAFVEWSRIERAAMVAAGEVDLLGAGSIVPIVYVDRAATHVAGPLEFDTFQAGSDLLVVDATIDDAGAITGVSAPRSLLTSCGVDPATVDVRGPDVNIDGTTVAFAMRTGAGTALQIYTVQLDGTGCDMVTTAEPDANGIKLHNFDPAWSPDGAWIVYASTRGGAGGPSRSRRLELPQSDLWRMMADGSANERITFLSNSELAPAFMREGRITMTTEKVDPLGGEFYQLAGRRMNWDLTDYHPLLAQRATSPYADAETAAATAPSVGFAQATDIREGFDGNFLLVLSESGSRAGAGTLAIFNRSVGPFELGRSDSGFLHAVTFPDPAATGRGQTDGAYRGPQPLLDGTILVSYAGGSFDLASATSFDWDLVSVDPRDGARTTIVGGPGAQVDAVLALKQPARKLYYNRRQLVFGGQQAGDEDRAIVHFPDAPMLATLLDSNLRRGRPIDVFRPATHIVFLDADGGEIGRVPLAADGSARVDVPSRRPVVIRLANSGSSLFTMTEEHQYGPGENISMGVSEELFDFVCAGCHGSVSGREIDIAVKPDALTGASLSQSAAAEPTPID